MPLILVLLLAAIFVANYAWLLAAVLVTVTAGMSLGKWLARRGDRAVARRRWESDLCARADRQHQLALAGDDRGVYGDYPPDEGCKW
ncbi:hypothetical protein GBO17_06245 [Mycobacterium avium subsp. hominissuis]|uniref:hypothetical protein n=1 Tax=Mycobacterium avium TaxID=1764 RepID=UPI001CC3C5F5|nr:hypothetical protein [Mycobacterium avium]MBZ4557714.1 hypothetical protein [Mycobacterium avium subsp. hominissuis]MBZ4568086.1 hypothetical protein [Mycobacterium avium subsp. hominissuis]MBZ4586500.1 hypothetical protein [Mycobacterium avium subsp. hominissuis]MBZ4623489.1 hypothetical protein [Mycobacterium avium subsp. hominissuis]